MPSVGRDKLMAADQNTRVTAAVDLLTRLLGEVCPAAHIDLAGAVALPCPLPHAEKWRDWVAAGRHGDLDYLLRDPAGRADPTVKNPTAGTLLVFAQRYTDGWAMNDPDPSAGGPNSADTPWTARVSRYARGLDYHDVLLKDIKQVLTHLRTQWPALTAFPTTDTGPYLEREYAWLAGCGFLGHNRCLTHEKLGSGLFLGVALTNLHLEGLPASSSPVPEPLYAVTARTRHLRKLAPLDMCGTCTRCLDACPTNALDIVHGLDAGRCLSTWTIERQGHVPSDQASLTGGLLFGCDICQAVCPWNQRVAAQPAVADAPRDQYTVQEAHTELDLTGLAEISDAEFRSRLRKSPLWRAHPEGLRRNARRVQANLEDKP